MVLGYDLFAHMLNIDADMMKMARMIAYDEGLPVVPNPGILSPQKFVDELFYDRFPNEGEQLKKILDRSLRPTGQILLVITGGGIIRWVLQDCGMGNIIGPVLEKSGLPLVLVAFLIAALIRASVGAAVVAMTMAAGIMASMPGVAELSPVYLAAMVCAINGGATAFSHVNDSGFWLVNSLLEIDEKTTLQSWTMMETIIGITGLVCAVVISMFA